MPIYEFNCRTCGRKTTALVLTRNRLGEIRCRSCGGADLERLWSRFATPRSDEARLDRLADSAASVDESDPASVERWTRRMASEMGDDAEALDGPPDGDDPFGDPAADDDA